MFDGSHSHGGGSGGSHSHGSGGGLEVDPVVLLVCFAIVAAITAVNSFGGWVFRVMHGGYGPPAAGSWGSMYINIGWGVAWAILALGLLFVSAFKRNIRITSKTSVRTSAVALVAAGLAITFGLFIATHFAHKVGISNPWWGSSTSRQLPTVTYTPQAGSLCLLSKKEASVLTAQTVTTEGGVGSPSCSYGPQGEGSNPTKLTLEISAYANTASITNNGEYPLNGDKVRPEGPFSAAWTWPDSQFSAEEGAGTAAARLRGGGYLAIAIEPPSSVSEQQLVATLDLVMIRYHYDPRLRAIMGNNSVPLPRTKAAG